VDATTYDNAVGKSSLYSNRWLSNKIQTDLGAILRAYHCPFDASANPDGIEPMLQLCDKASWNAAGSFMVCVLAVFTSTEARAMLVTSSYSNHFIITTDERRSGLVHLPKEVGPSLAACWQAPHAGDQVTVQLSFKRDGSIFGKPRINYAEPVSASSSQELTESILKAIDACVPLQLTPRLAANIAGQVFVIRFIAP
jgi:hypothetical protein